MDQFEMYEAGTLLDVANRAEKRGVIETVDWLRELKDTRNRIPSSTDYSPITPFIPRLIIENHLVIG